MKGNEQKKRFIDTPRFVPLDLLEPLQGRESRKEDKTVLTLVGVGIIWFIISFISHRFIRDILETGFIVTALLQLAVGLIVVYVSIAKFVFKVDDSRKTRVIEGKGNKAITLGGIWGINPGGIYKKKIDGKDHTAVRYTGREAVVLKFLKQSVLTTDENTDRAHYAALQRIEDVALKAGYRIVKLNTRYNPDNDYIWDKLDENIAKSSKVFGKTYTQIMADIQNYHYEYTKVNSNVTVMYYILIPNMVSARRPLEKLIPEIKEIINSSRLKFSNITWRELDKVFKDYYGVNYLDLEEIFSNMGSVTDLEVKTISYIDSNGEYVKLKPYFKPDITSDFTSLAPKPKIVKKEKTSKELRQDIIIDIFKEKVI